MDREGRLILREDGMHHREWQEWEKVGGSRWKDLGDGVGQVECLGGVLCCSHLLENWPCTAISFIPAEGILWTSGMIAVDV